MSTKTLSELLALGADKIEMDRDHGDDIYLKPVYAKEEDKIVWCGCAIGATLVGYFGSPTETRRQMDLAAHPRRLLARLISKDELAPLAYQDAAEKVEILESYYEGWHGNDAHSFAETIAFLKEKGW